MSKNRNNWFGEANVEVANESVKANTAIETSNKNFKIKNTEVRIDGEVPATPSEKPVFFRPYNVQVDTFLNVRQGPDLSFMIVRTQFAGNKLRILEEKDGWGRIEEDQWINLQYTHKI